MSDPSAANAIVSMPSQLFTMARSFKANANGRIYIGQIDTDPVTVENQIPVYVENEDGSRVEVPQPIMIGPGGLPVHNGQISTFVTAQSHSMAILDARGVQQFYFSNVQGVNWRAQGDVRGWGAKGDGIHDDSPAIQAAINAVSAAGGGDVYLPEGCYSAGRPIIPASNIVLRGDGRSITKIIVPVGNASRNQILTNLTNAITNLTIQGIGFEGRWNDYKSEFSDNGLLTLKFVDGLVIKDCAFRFSRFLSINVNECGRVKVTGCLFEYGTRDFCAIWGSPDVQISNNTLRGNDDDAISVNWESAGTEPVRSQIIITGNLLEDTGGIRTQAPKNVVITNNTLRRTKGVGINLGVSNTSRNDISSAHGIIIANNVITDVIDRQWFVNGDQVGSSNSRIYIFIRSIKPMAGSLAVPPGEINPTIGKVQSPYDNYYKLGSVAAAVGSIRAPDGAIVHGNICKRTMPSGANYSAWGYGQAFSAKGFIDYNISESVLRGIGIRIELPWTSLIVESNLLEPGRYGIDFALASGVTIANRLAKGIAIRNNTIKDTDLYGINWGASPTLSHQDILIERNTIDGDPYFTNSNRGPNGTFNVVGTPEAIRIQNVGGINISRNRFRNVCQVLDQVGASAYQYVHDNELYGDANTTGFSSSNKGIGNMPPIAGGEQFWLQYEDSDPTSATYGQSLGVNVRNSSGMPSTGKYLTGTVVPARNNSPAGSAGSQYIVTGWVRRTTGSSHVLNTDWSELRCLTGT